MNLGDAEATADLTGTILVGSNRERDGERVEGLTLGPSEAALVAL
jgi:hypothetical protein